MTRPSFQFYPGDWQKNANLRRCSPAARGVWIDVLCILHDSEEYGVLRWPLKDIANAAGASMAHVRELVDKGVLKGADQTAASFVYQPTHAGKKGELVTLVASADGPCWYSSRFVKDEWVRLRRGSGTRFDENNQPPKGGPDAAPKATPKGAPNPPIGGRLGDGPSSSSSSSPSGNTSDPDGSGAEAPAEDRREEPRPEQPSAKDVVFALGVPLLTAAGVTDKNARSFLAMKVKASDDETVAKALEACAIERPIEPLTWLQTRIKSTAARTGRHTGFAAKNYHEGVTEDGSFT